MQDCPRRFESPKLHWYRPGSIDNTLACSYRRDSTPIFGLLPKALINALSLSVQWCSRRLPGRLHWIESTRHSFRGCCWDRRGAVGCKLHQSAAPAAAPSRCSAAVQWWVSCLQDWHGLEYSNPVDALRRVRWFHGALKLTRLLLLGSERSIFEGAPCQLVATGFLALEGSVRKDEGWMRWVLRLVTRHHRLWNEQWPNWHGFLPCGTRLGNWLCDAASARSSRCAAPWEAPPEHETHVHARQDLSEPHQTGACHQQQLAGRANNCSAAGSVHDMVNKGAVHKYTLLSRLHCTREAKSCMMSHRDSGHRCSIISIRQPRGGGGSVSGARHCRSLSSLHASADSPVLNTKVD